MNKAGLEMNENIFGCMDFKRTATPQIGRSRVLESFRGSPIIWRFAKFGAPRANANGLGAREPMSKVCHCKKFVEIGNINLDNDVIW
jgi:hypothetical protein